MLKIGPVELDNPFILAPLAGYTDLPFRLLCRKYGAALCYSEMISSHGLVYQHDKTLQMLTSVKEERPVAMQLFGAEPEMMGAAAAIASQFPIDIIDLNMGCPVKKVVKKGGGSALMKTPALAEQIIRQVCKNSSKPVTVKIRSGWTHQEINGPEFAQMAEGAGAQAIAVHARTWSDGFAGTPDRQIIARVKEAVAVPVIGNGDIHSHAEGLQMMAETGCDAVMIGRAALGAPWIFQAGQPNPDQAFRVQALARHLELLAAFFEPDRILGRIKNQAGRYFKGVSGGAAFRKMVYDARSFQELQELITTLLAPAA